MVRTLNIWILIAASALVAMAAALPRYSVVATTTFNVGGAYKLDRWTGKIWLCHPTAILIDNKTVVAPKGCYRIEDTVATGLSTNNL